MPFGSTTHLTGQAAAGQRIIKCAKLSFKHIRISTACAVTQIRVSGTGVFVGVGGTGVFVGGTGVFVGGTGVFVGGTGVFVGGTGVFVGVAPPKDKPTTIGS